MPDPRPLHVRVAEVLGCKPVFRKAYPGDREPRWCCDCATQAHVNPHRCDPFPEDPELAHYDEDWSALGPVIEKYGILLARSFDDDDRNWVAAWPERWACGLSVGDTWVEAETLFYADGPTPLVAACECLLMAAERGLLK